MISSAVSIPDATPHVQPPTEPAASPSRKRRNSSEAPEPDASKRARLDTSTTNGSNPRSPPHPATATATSPPRRKSTLPNNRADEKSRSRRLFGGLLSTLSASSKKPSSAIKRRDEIEQRQRERLKRDDEEVAEARRKKRDELDRVRRTEQRRWDEQSVRIRHANMRAMAGFLRTETEPRIYWRPWELRGEDEGRVKRQREEVEESILKELSERKSDGELVNGEKEGEAGEARQNSHGADGQATESRSANAVKDEPQKVEKHDDADTGHDSLEAGKEDPSGLDHPAPEAVGLDDMSKDDDHVGDDDHAGDELVEGHDEDQVIY